MRIRIRAGKYRIPDISVLDRANPKEQVPSRPPIAAFEVLSPEDTVQELYEKLDDYTGMGIPQIWVLDPKTSSFRRYVDGSLIPSSRLSFQERGIDFDLSAIAALPLD